MTPVPVVRFQPQAAEEAEVAFQWYAERSPLAARAFLSELNHAVEMVRAASLRWPRFGNATRRYIFPRFPFSLIYRVRETSVEVIAVAHHKRKPGYWRVR